MFQVVRKANCLPGNIVASVWTLIERVLLVRIVVEDLSVDVVIGMTPSLWYLFFR